MLKQLGTYLQQFKLNFELNWEQNNTKQILSQCSLTYHHQELYRLTIAGVNLLKVLTPISAALTLVPLVGKIRLSWKDLDKWQVINVQSYFHKEFSPTLVKGLRAIGAKIKDQEMRLFTKSET